MPHLIAIDQSTSATKALLFDSTGNLVERFAKDHRQIYPRPGFVEHDAEEIWANTLDVLADLTRRGGDKVRDAACLSIANQRETFVVFDRATGKPLHHAIVWQCRRGDEICAELRPKFEEVVARKTGLKIDTYFSASKLSWLIRHDPAIAKKLASGEALFGTIDAYLIYRLTGGKVFACDHTNASRTLLLNIQTLAWDAELCGIFNVPMACLPELRDSTGRFGETDAGGRLPKALPICGVMGDSQASLFAHRCFETGMAKMTLGSGSSVLLNIGPKNRSAGDAAVSTIAWTHRGSAMYCFEGIISYCAATISWLKDQLKLIESPEETESAALAVPDNGGVYLVPAFAGLSAPHWSPGARAAIVGMTAHANRNHVIRAALESIAYQLRDVLEMMGDRGGVKLGKIHADGGASRNPFLMQFIADMVGLEIVAAQVAECSPLGAALAGGLGMGLYSTLDAITNLPHHGKIYSPSMPAERASQLYAGWKGAVKQVLAGTE